MSKKSITGQIAEQYIRDYPKTATWTLARMMYRDNSTAFNSLTHARDIIRNHRGEKGAESRTSKTFKELGKTKEYHLPETWAEKKDIFKIPTGYKNIGIISDAQCPFHDVRATEIAVKYLQDKQIDCLFMNGDMIDAYHLSSFERDPRRRNFKEEREACISYLGWIKSQFRKIPVYYSLDANHEQRFERYMKVKAPELFSTELYKLEDLLCLHDLGIIPLRGYDHCRVGRLPILHGHTVFKGAVSPVSPARTVQMKLQTSALVSHVHKVSQYTWKDLDGETYSAWSTGCLMSIDKVEYSVHGNMYTHGFAIVKILNDKGEYMVENKMIINGNVH